MKLYFLNGKRAGETFDLNPPGISLGRETDNDISILVDGVSRYHAKIEWIDSCWQFRDLGSTNGSKINGEKIEGLRTLSPGDEIKLGGQELSFGERRKVDDLQPDPLPVDADEPKTAPDPLPPSPETAATTDDEPMKGFMDSFNEAENHEATRENVSKFFDNIDLFNADNEPKGKGASSERTTEKAKKHFSLLFYVAVICGAVIFTFLFLMWDKIRKESSTAPRKVVRNTKQRPLLLVYEKKSTKPDNIFRFYLKIENGDAFFELDDIKHHRNFSKTKKDLPQYLLDQLSECIKSTSFMKLSQEAAGASSNGNSERRSLLISCGDDLNEIVVENNFAPTSFEEIEVAVEDFAKEFLGVRATVLTVEEMKLEAKKSFDKAQDLFYNCDARPANLNEALKRYQDTMDLLDSFLPKPDEWNIARKNSIEAKNMLDERVNGLLTNAEKAWRFKDYGKASQEYSIIMKMLDSDDKRYKKAKKNKMLIDDLLKKLKK